MSPDHKVVENLLSSAEIDRSQKTRRRSGDGGVKVVRLFGLFACRPNENRNRRPL